MPIERSAFKQIRKDKKRRLRNISTISAIKTWTKKLNSLISSKNKQSLEEGLKRFTSLVDKAAQRGIIHKKTASRKIARISKKVFRSLKAS